MLTGDDVLGPRKSVKCLIMFIGQFIFIWIWTALKNSYYQFSLYRSITCNLNCQFYLFIHILIYVFVLLLFFRTHWLKTTCPWFFVLLRLFHHQFYIQLVFKAPPCITLMISDQKIVGVGGSQLKKKKITFV